MANTYQTGDATKANILLTSKRLFFQKGYIATTYTDISNEAGVNRALIPYHFKNKSVLGSAVYQEILQDAFSLLDNILDMEQFSSDFVGMLHLMTFYHLSKIPSFSRFCVQVLKDAGNTLFHIENEKQELQQISRKIAQLPESQLDLLAHMNIGIKQQMMQYLYEHKDTSIKEIANTHTALILSYTGQSRKKTEELIEAACEILDLISFEFNDDFEVSIAYR